MCKQTQKDIRGTCMNDLKKYNILITEDSESILIALRDYLISTFSVFTASTYEQALQILQTNLHSNNPITLLIADIHLQEKSGIELIRQARKMDANIKTALITSYQINDYIDSIYQYEIDQVITKHSSMSLYDIQVMAYKTITQDIFGFEKYFPDIKITAAEQSGHLCPQDKEIFSFTVHSFQEAMLYNDRISQNVETYNGVSPAVIRLILDELTTNALFKAPRDKNGNFKYFSEDKNKLCHCRPLPLDEEDYFVLQYGYYQDWLLIACIDPHGTLAKQEILYRLRRHILRDNNTGFPQGLIDSHGRGLFLLREHLTHLIFNLEAKHKTEVLGFYRKGRDIPYKNISIYEKQ